MIYISSDIDDIQLKHENDLNVLESKVEEVYASKTYVSEVALGIETEDLQFVSSIDEMIDTKKNYVMKTTGEIWSYQNIDIDNKILSSINQDGSLCGLLYDCRYNSSDALVNISGAASTGFIACKPNDIIRFKNIIFNKETHGNVTPGSIYLRYYDSNFNQLIQYTPYYDIPAYMCKNIEYDSDGNLVLFTISTSYNVAYIRMSFVYTNELPIITVNQDIDLTCIFRNTGLYYGMEALEIVSNVGEMHDINKKYVLETTGTIWRYSNLISTDIVDSENLFVKDTIALNKNPDGTERIGSFTTDFIAINATLQDPFIITFKGINSVTSLPLIYKIAYYDKNYNQISIIYAHNTKHEIIDDSLLLYIDYNSNDDSKYFGSGIGDIKYIKVLYNYKDSELTSIDEITQDISITMPIQNSSNNYTWRNTGLIYAGVTNDEAVVELEGKVIENSNNIYEIREILNNLIVDDEIVSIPSYWKKAIDDLEENILLQLDEGGIDSFGFIWGADIHGVNGYTNSNGHGTSVTKNIGYICQYATEKYDLPFVIFSGDIMSQASHSSESSVHIEHEAMWDLFSPISNDKLLIEKGNHDGAYGTAVNGVYYLYNIGGKEIFNNLFRRQTLDRTRVFGGDGSYFYVDMPKMRVIMLNGHTDGDGSQDTNGYAIYNSMKNSIYGTEQLKWLAEIALNVPENTRIIVSAHQPLVNNGDGNLVLGILNAYNNKTSYSNSINITTDTWGNGIESEYNASSISVDFTNAKGKVLAFFHGHIHKDTIDSTSNTFIIASITTAGGDVRDTTIVERVPNTSTETALDIVIITKEKIYFNRLGAGYDREVSLI